MYASLSINSSTYLSFPNRSLFSMECHLILFSVVHLVLLSQLFPSTSSAVKHNNFTDLSALLAFKARVSDPDHILSTNWTTNTSFCTWTGVSCSRRRQRVVAIRIVNLPLYGTIAPQIANLSFISYLFFSNNSLFGSIPESLAHMPRLKTLVIHSNGLSGTIPPAIFNMSLLTYLYFVQNNLSGTLPSNLTFTHSMLPRVQNLSLSDNHLSGNIPFGLSHCYHLRLLALSFNQFSGNIPSELGNLKQLRALYLGVNNLTGKIPASLGNLTNLLGLDLSNNTIHGDIPKELGRLVNLQVLILNYNYGITGSIPISLSNMSSLTIIELTYLKLTGSVHVNFGNMPQLNNLQLWATKLTGGLDFIGSLSNCRVLEYVGLAENELDGSLPNTIGNLSRNLLQFSLYGNHIKGKIPVEVGNLSNLEVLQLGSNELTGTIPFEITMLEKLQSLDLGDNRIYGSIPHELGRLRIMNELYLFMNTLSGSIPDSLGNISALEHLLLHANALSSGIPQSMWNLTRLINIDLSQNLLTGFLSPAVGNLKALNTLNISVNQLSGSIPNALKELQMLSILDLSNNSFDGSIPPSFGDLISIEVLNLSCNNLSGVIPDSLADLRYLNSINLSFNKLEGEVPKRGAFRNPTIVTLMGNAALCGAPNLGLPPCTATNPRSRVHLLKYILPAIAFTIVLLACICLLLRSQRKQIRSPAPTTALSVDNYRLISYHEIVRATQNFSEANLLGSGSFGSVYKGCLDDGLLTAIKVLNLEADGASRSFDAECSALRMVRHRNLVKIISTCSNLDFKALVLQFMPNGSLERWLYCHNYCLNLLQRITIVIDVASALEYLHHRLSQVILHCDLKPSNILLDEDMTAHVSDFGIAKLLAGDSRSVASASATGTIGYIPPEYASTGRVSRKGDVYSFGVLLLEIFTRKKPTDPMFSGESSLRRWVYEASPAALLEIVDCNLLKDVLGNGRHSEDLIAMQACLSSIMELGVICSDESAKKRPTMEEVVPRLQKIKMEYISKVSNA